MSWIPGTSSDSARRCAASRDARCLRMAEIKRPGPKLGQNTPWLRKSRALGPQKNRSLSSLSITENIADWLQIRWLVMGCNWYGQKDCKTAFPSQHPNPRPWLPTSASRSSFPTSGKTSGVNEVQPMIIAVTRKLRKANENLMRVKESWSCLQRQSISFSSSQDPAIVEGQQPSTGTVTFPLPATFFFTVNVLRDLKGSVVQRAE